jgi:hypothetical protein
LADLKIKPAGETLRQFMLSEKFVRGIRGPIGSAKSTTCATDLMRHSITQAANAEGIARTRNIIVRNTNPQLRSTTIKTWLDIFPEKKFGKFNWSAPYTHRIIRKVGDRTVDMENIFLALDRPDDIGKLLSLEATMIWVNEAREVPKSIIDACTSRVGRFPPAREGGGATFAGVIMDTNAPEHDHWWPIMAGESPLPEYISADEALMLAKPDNWEFFCQPPAMIEDFDSADRNRVVGYRLNPEAENLQNLRTDAEGQHYYENLIRGKTKSWIDVYVMNRLGLERTGKVVHPSFRREVHVARGAISFTPDQELHIGLDFGLTPAAIFAQCVFGQWRVLHELVTQNMGARRFGELLRREIRVKFPQVKTIRITGDPAGDQRSQADEMTPFMILGALGITAFPAPTNDFVVRTGALDMLLERMVDGQPGIVFDPSCTVLTTGLESGYVFRQLQTTGEARYEEKPLKNRYSHPIEALHYLLVGGGEWKDLTIGKDVQLGQVFNARPTGSTIFERRAGLQTRPRAHDPFNRGRRGL